MHLCFCYYFEQAHLVMFSGLMVFLFCEAVILYSLLIGPILHPIFFFFCVLPNLWFEKIETLSNYIGVRLVPCLAEWIIS